MKHLVFFLITVLSAVHLYADKASLREKEIRFIKELYRNKRYFDCIAEAGKIQSAEKKAEIDYFIYSNYFLAGEYSSVIYNFRPDFSSGHIQFPQLLLLSRSFFNKGMYPESYELLKKTGYNVLPGDYIFPMFLRRIEPLLLDGRLDKIEEEIADSGIFLKDNYNFIKLKEELNKYSSEGIKSSSLAVVLSSVVPGAGQLYAGYPAEGLITLLSTAAAAAGGFYMRDKGKKSFSCTIFFFTGLFYAGNIYGAYNSAESANSDLFKKRHKAVISKYGSYSPEEYIDIENTFR